MKRLSLAHVAAIIALQPVEDKGRDDGQAAQKEKWMAEIPLGSKAQELFPESDIQYFLRDEPTRVIFDVNPDGSVTGLEFITTYVHWHREKNP